MTKVILWSGNSTVVASGLSSPRDIALDAAGEFAYVVSSSGDLTRLNLSGGTQTFVTSPTGASGIGLGLPLPPTAEPSRHQRRSVRVDPHGPGHARRGHRVRSLSADLTIEWNDAILTANLVAQGSLAGSCTVTST